jgi:phthiodiolone/phenolphthiodiolone dimycocerosates ketoreductase
VAANRSTVRVSLSIPPTPPVSQLKHLVFGARLTGLDSLLFWDHIQHFLPQSIWTEETYWQARDQPHIHALYDYQTLLGYLAGRAGNLRLGVGVTEPLRRHPVVIAQAALTLSHLTRRPPILGIGAGELENTVPYGISMEKPVGKLEEALQIIRACFTTIGPFDFEGEHFKLRSAVVDLEPRDDPPPIWVAARRPRMLRLAGQYGDGWLPQGVETPEEYGDLLSTIRNHARDANRDPDAILPALNLTAVPAPTRDQAREIMRDRSMKVVALSEPDHVWRRFGLAHPLGEGFRGFVDIMPEEIPPDEIEAALEQVPEGLLEHVCLWGTPDEIAEQIRLYAPAGLQHISILPASAMHSAAHLRYLPLALRRIRRLLS